MGFFRNETADARVAALEKRVEALEGAAYVRYYDPDSCRGAIGHADRAPASEVLSQVLVFLKLSLSYKHAQPSGHAVTPLAAPKK